MGSLPLTSNIRLRRLIFLAKAGSGSTAVQSFANSPLVLCLTAALGLSLLFRIGTRRFGQVEWSDSEESINTAIDFLRAKAKDWKIGASLVETSDSHKVVVQKK
jgi:hypothetical protein